MSRQQIDFWFTMRSTYSYLSVTRLPDVAASTGVSFRWRPFHLLTLLQEMKHARLDRNICRRASRRCSDRFYDAYGHKFVRFGKRSRRLVLEHGISANDSIDPTETWGPDRNAKRDVQMALSNTGNHDKRRSPRTSHIHRPV